MFGFQRLHVYQRSLAFVSVAQGIIGKLPRGNAELADQLRRAALSIPSNIAEGSGRPGADARRFYAMARGSAFECASLLDVCERLELASAEDIENGRQLLLDVVRMLTKMAAVGQGAA